MPSLNLKTKTLRYAKADETVIESCLTLLNAIVEYDAAAKMDGTTARGALMHVKKHIEKQRTPAVKSDADDSK